MNGVKHPFPWQSTLWTDWQRQIGNRRLPHAVLVSGMTGLGKRHLAEALTHAVLCTSDAEKPCGRCKSCQLLIAESHPDLRIVEPEEAGKAIKIDQVRELVSFLAGTAQQGGWKCVVLDPADAMNAHAANALLKSLEEPPGDSLILLVSSSPGRLMPTLRSRCRLLPVAPPHREQALSWLEARVGSRATELLDYAQGAPLAAVAASENGALAERDEMLEILLELAERQGTVVDAAKRVQGMGATTADQMLNLLSRLARSRVGKAGPLEEERWQALAERVDPALLFRFQDKLLQAKHLLLSGANPNPQLLWEELMLDWRALTRSPAGTRPRVPAV